MKYREKEMTIRYYKGCCLDDGDYIDYGLMSGSPSQSWWMIPGTWKGNDYIWGTE